MIGGNLAPAAGTFQRGSRIVNRRGNWPRGTAVVKTAKPSGGCMTIELHSWNTPNGRKIAVALEEMGLPYTVIPVNITKGEQQKPEFLALSPPSAPAASSHSG